MSDPPTPTGPSFLQAPQPTPSLQSPIEIHISSFPQLSQPLIPSLPGFRMSSPLLGPSLNPQSGLQLAPRLEQLLSSTSPSRTDILSPPSRPLPASPPPEESPRLHVSPTPQSPPKESPLLGFQTSAFLPRVPNVSSFTSVLLSIGYPWQPLFHPRHQGSQI